MEPCLFRHGKLFDLLLFLDGFEQLQWSHVFSDMVRNGWTELRALVEPLQWSHVFSDMVSDWRRRDHRPAALASMEPCLFRHGKQIIDHNTVLAAGASMEPCLFRHGKARRLKKKVREIEQLQWSHVFSDMVSKKTLLYYNLVDVASMEPCLFRHGKYDH